MTGPRTYDQWKTTPPDEWEPQTDSGPDEPDPDDDYDQWLVEQADKEQFVEDYSDE